MSLSLMINPASSFRDGGLVCGGPAFGSLENPKAIQEMRCGFSMHALLSPVIQICSN